VQPAGTVVRMSRPGRGSYRALVQGPRDHLWLLMFRKLKELDARGRVLAPCPTPPTTSPSADCNLWSPDVGGVDRVTVGRGHHSPLRTTNPRTPGHRTWPDGKLWMASYFVNSLPPTRPGVQDQHVRPVPCFSTERRPSGGRRPACTSTGRRFDQPRPGRSAGAAALPLTEPTSLRPLAARPRALTGDPTRRGSPRSRGRRVPPRPPEVPAPARRMGAPGRGSLCGRERRC
jgi:hypothetical protein